MSDFYELPEPLRTGNTATDKNFKKLFKRIKHMLGVSQRATTALRHYPFGEDIDVYLEYDVASASVIWYVEGEKQEGMNE